MLCPPGGLPLELAGPLPHMPFLVPESPDQPLRLWPSALPARTTLKKLTASIMGMRSQAVEEGLLPSAPSWTSFCIVKVRKSWEVVGGHRYPQQPGSPLPCRSELAVRGLARSPCHPLLSPSILLYRFLSSIGTGRAVMKPEVRIQYPSVAPPPVPHGGC